MLTQSKDVAEKQNPSRTWYISLTWPLRLKVFLICIGSARKGTNSNEYFLHFPHNLSLRKFQWKNLRRIIVVTHDDFAFRAKCYAFMPHHIIRKGVDLSYSFIKYQYLNLFFFLFLFTLFSFLRCPFCYEKKCLYCKKRRTWLMINPSTSITAAFLLKPLNDNR